MFRTVGPGQLLLIAVLLAVAPLAPTSSQAAPLVPYTEEEVRFANGDVTLAGTLTLPIARQLHPAVILISGSGPQDRDETIPGISGYAPFRWIADHLGRHGITVLRYDDRGVAKSTGTHELATTLDFASDAEAAVRHPQGRREIDRARIGLLRQTYELLGARLRESPRFLSDEGHRGREDHQDGETWSQEGGAPLQSR